MTEIESDVPAPTEPAKRGRGRKRKETVVPATETAANGASPERAPLEHTTPVEAPAGRQTSALLEAMQFVSVAAKDGGIPYQSHVRFINQSVVAFNGTLAAGSLVQEDIMACPNAEQLISALKRAGSTLNITLLDNLRMSIRGERMHAHIECLPSEQMPFVAPDMPIAVIDDRLKEAFKAVAVLASDSGVHVVQSSLLLRANTVVATDRMAIVEYWHGIDLPPDLVIPKTFASAIVKCPKKLAHFGWTPGNSITFWFEDNTWIKTQLYQDPWPSIDDIINFTPVEMIPVPDDLAEAIDAVAPFSGSLTGVTLGEGMIRTHPGLESVGASYEMPGFNGYNRRFSAKLLKTCLPMMKQMDLKAEESRLLFYGENMRGVVLGIKTEQ